MNVEAEVFSEVLGILESCDVEYLITGSIAKTYYSIPRMTRDMDILISLNEEDTLKFLSRFPKEYYVDEFMIKSAIKDKQSFNIIHNKKLVKVDFILNDNTKFEKIKFQRKKRIKLFGKSVWMISPEDLILSKLKWAQESLSEMQLNDVSDLLRSVEEIDDRYLQDWLKELELEKVYKMAKEKR